MSDNEEPHSGDEEGGEGEKMETKGKIIQRHKMEIRVRRRVRRGEE
jgi:hypothetical protein